MKKEDFFEFMDLEKDVIELQRRQKVLSEYTPQTMVMGKVKGSDKNFPYLLRSFTIEGADKIANDKIAKEKARTKKMLEDKEKELIEKRAEMYVFIETIENELHRNIFRLLLERKTQNEIAEALYIGQASVSKIIKKYLKD